MDRLFYAVVLLLALSVVSAHATAEEGDDDWWDDLKPSAACAYGTGM